MERKNNCAMYNAKNYNVFFQFSLGEKSKGEECEMKMCGKGEKIGILNCQLDLTK